MMSKNDISAYMSEWMRDRKSDCDVFENKTSKKFRKSCSPLMFLSEQDGFE